MRAVQAIGVSFAVAAIAVSTPSWAAEARAGAGVGYRYEAYPGGVGFTSDPLTKVNVTPVGVSPLAEAQRTLDKSHIGDHAVVAVRGEAVALARVAALRVVAIANAHAENHSWRPSVNIGLAEAGASATASWKDIVVTTVPDRPIGVPVTVHGSIFLEGYLNTGAAVDGGRPNGGNAHSTATVSVAHLNGFVIVAGSQRTPPNPLIPDVNVPVDVDVPWTFFNGVPREIGATLTVTASTVALRGFDPPNGGISDAHASSDYSQTLKWGGITRVADGVTGEPIENWTITSESGFDYSKPYVVPEPSNAVLLCFGCCAWLGSARPRRWRS